MQLNVNMGSHLTSDWMTVSFFRKESSNHIVLQHHLALYEFKILRYQTDEAVSNPINIGFII